MNPDVATEGPKIFQVRLSFLFVCALVVLSIGPLPYLVRGRLLAQGAVLLLAAIPAAFGWFFVLNDTAPSGRLRTWAVLITAAYLTISLPAYFVELFTTIGFCIHHPALLVFMKPWVRWGYVIYIGFIASFLGRGRARVAWVRCSTSLMILWESTGTWL